MTNFCRALRLEPDEAESAVIYLTYLFEAQQLSGIQLMRRLSFIDLARRLDGVAPLRADRQVRLFMRGLLRTASLHEGRERGDPVYREILAALIDQTMGPTPKQVRLRAAVLLLHHTGWPAVAIARLKWAHVDLRRSDRTVIVYPAGPRGLKRSTVDIAHSKVTHPLREALDRASELGDESPFVTWPSKDYQPRKAPFLVVKSARALARTGGDPVAALELVSRTPEQLRNRAALVLGFGAALTTSEAQHLNQEHVEVTPHGLVIHVPGRSRALGIHRDPGSSTDPLRAWEDWIAELASWGRQASREPALLDAHQLGVHPHRIGERGLNWLVQRPAQALRLGGSYAWSSLRWGGIRSAIRDNERTHHVAALAATSLTAVVTHQQREQLISHSVAGQLGL